MSVDCGSGLQKCHNPQWLACTTCAAFSGPKPLIGTVIRQKKFWRHHRTVCHVWQESCMCFSVSSNTRHCPTWKSPMFCFTVVRQCPRGGVGPFDVLSHDWVVRALVMHPRNDIKLHESATVTSNSAMYKYVHRCTFSGVYVPCIYLHAMWCSNVGFWVYRRRLGVCCCLPCLLSAVNSLWLLIRAMYTCLILLIVDHKICFLYSELNEWSNNFFLLFRSRLRLCKTSLFVGRLPQHCGICIGSKQSIQTWQSFIYRTNAIWETDFQLQHDLENKKT